MPTNAKRDVLNVLQQLVAFAEGETLSIPVPVLTVGEGLLAPNHHTMSRIATATRREREVLQVELRHYLRGIAKGHGEMVRPYQVRTEVVTHAASAPVSNRRGQHAGRAASYLIEGEARDWVFNLVDRVLPAVVLDVLQPCPGCERAFVKVTRKRFCSARCQTRSYMRAWRAEARAGKGKTKTS